MQNNWIEGLLPELHDQLSGFLYLRLGQKAVSQRLGELEPVLSPWGEQADISLPRYTFVSSRAFLGERLLGSTGPFRYPVVLWSLGWGEIFLGLNKEVMQYFEQHVVDRYLLEFVTHVTADVHGMLMHVLEDSALTVSFAHVRMRSHQSALHTMSYYGDNLKMSRRFLDDVTRFRAQTIRIDDVESGERLITIGRDGFLSFSRSATPTVGPLLKIFYNKGYFRPEAHRRGFFDTPGS